MKLGFSLPLAGAWATPQNQIRVAQRAEALGYHSLWTFQRLLYAHFDPRGADLGRALEVMEALAPGPS